MQFYIGITGLLALGPLVTAYSNNCRGSPIGCTGGCVTDCYKGLNTIDRGAEYTDQVQFSNGHCYIKYATNNSGDQPVSGQVIFDTANTILNECGPSIGPQQPGAEGSYGTGNCPECHVTINYRG